MLHKRNAILKKATAFSLLVVMIATSGMSAFAEENVKVTSTDNKVSTASTEENTTRDPPSESEAESDTEDDTLYSVYAMDTENGTIYVNGETEEVEIESGKTVTVTYEADEGYELSSINFLNDDAEEVETTFSDGAYTFEMPEMNVVVLAEFQSIDETKSDEDIVWHSRTAQEIADNLGIEVLNANISLASNATITGNTYTDYGCASAQIRINGGVGFCVLPWSKVPNGITATFADIAINGTSDNANYQLMAKLIYYGYGGGGDLGYGETITHFALSKIWYNMGNTYNSGLSWTYSGSSYLNAAGQAKVNEFINKVGSLTNVKGTLRISQLYASGGTYQDIVYGSFEPIPTITYTSPRITIRKVDKQGKALAGAEFTVYGYNKATGGYTNAIETKTTDSDGLVVFSSLGSLPNNAKTGNGLFLVKETKTPNGYSASETYLNDADKADFEKYGGRLYYIKLLVEAALHTEIQLL